MKITFFEKSFILEEQAVNKIALSHYRELDVLQQYLNEISASYLEQFLSSMLRAGRKVLFEEKRNDDPKIQQKNDVKIKRILTEDAGVNFSKQLIPIEISPESLLKNFKQNSAEGASTFAFQERDFLLYLSKKELGLGTLFGFLDLHKIIIELFRQYAERTCSFCGSRINKQKIPSSFLHSENWRNFLQKILSKNAHTFSGKLLLVTAPLKIFPEGLTLQQLFDLFETQRICFGEKIVLKNHLNEEILSIPLKKVLERSPSEISASLSSSEKNKFSGMLKLVVKSLPLARIYEAIDEEQKLLEFTALINAAYELGCEEFCIDIYDRKRAVIIFTDAFFAPSRCTGCMTVQSTPEEVYSQYRRLNISEVFGEKGRKGHGKEAVNDLYSPLKCESSAIRLFNLPIQSYATMTFDELHNIIEAIEMSHNEKLRERLLEILSHIRHLGLSRFPLFKPIAELSTGEQIKVELAKLAAHDLSNTLLLFDSFEELYISLKEDISFTEFEKKICEESGATILTVVNHFEPVSEKILSALEAELTAEEAGSYSDTKQVLSSEVTLMLPAFHEAEQTKTVTIHHGKVNAVIGGIGSGKTSLLRSIVLKGSFRNSNILNHTSLHNNEKRHFIPKYFEFLYREEEETASLYEYTGIDFLFARYFGSTVAMRQKGFIPRDLIVQQSSKRCINCKGQGGIKNIVSQDRFQGIGNLFHKYIQCSVCKGRLFIDGFSEITLPVNFDNDPKTSEENPGNRMMEADGAQKNITLLQFLSCPLYKLKEKYSHNTFCRRVFGITEAILSSLSNEDTLNLLVQSLTLPRSSRILLSILQLYVKALLSEVKHGECYLFDDCTVLLSLYEKKILFILFRHLRLLGITIVYTSRDSSLHLESASWVGYINTI
jgi:energy-coupling factor transporter ATP-binding protein EcfA2